MQPPRKSNTAIFAPSRCVEVVETWLRVQLLFEHEHAFVLHDVANLAVGIEEVPEFARADGADLHARGIPPIAHALDTERAFLDNPFGSRPISQIMSFGVH